MNPTPHTSPAIAYRRTAGSSRAPTARPTNTAVADPTPTGTMNVSDARLIAV